MSRYPFKSAVNQYMSDIKGAYAENSWKAAGARYRRMEKDFQMLFDKGKVSTMNPKKFTVSDVRTYMIYRKSLGLTPKEYSHDASHLKSLLLYFGNNAVAECYAKFPILKNRYTISERLPPLEDGIYNKIIKNSKKATDFKTIRSYAMVVLCAGCGTRLKEIRLCNLADLDTEKWLLRLIHVKGEGTYGFERTIPVPKEAQEILLKWVKIRDMEMKSRGRESPALFPSFSGDSKYLSANTMRKIKELVVKEVGSNFDFRACRRDFCQRNLDNKVSTDSVSYLMGHASTATTNKYYGRIRNSHAIDEIREVWDGQ